MSLHLEKGFEQISSFFTKKSRPCYCVA